MSFSKSLARLIPEDDDIDLIEFMKFRQERDEISNDEIDYERAEECGLARSQGNGSGGLRARGQREDAVGLML